MHQTFLYYFQFGFFLLDLFKPNYKISLRNLKSISLSQKVCKISILSSTIQRSFNTFFFTSFICSGLFLKTHGMSMAKNSVEKIFLLDFLTVINRDFLSKFMSTYSVKYFRMLVCTNVFRKLVKCSFYLFKTPCNCVRSNTMLSDQSRNHNREAMIGVV